MKLSDIKVDVDKTFGRKFWLVDVAPVYEYKDGNKTDHLEGYRYTVTLPVQVEMKASRTKWQERRRPEE